MTVMTFHGICGRCGMESDDRTEHENHAASHTELVCVYCQTTFWSKPEFVWHLRLHELFRKQTLTDVDVERLLVWLEGSYIAELDGREKAAA